LKLPANISGEQDVQTISPITQGALFQRQGVSGEGVETGPAIPAARLKKRKYKKSRYELKTHKQYELNTRKSRRS
jgi:hypothetical protein